MLNSFLFLLNGKTILTYLLTKKILGKDYETPMLIIIFVG